MVLRAESKSSEEESIKANEDIRSTPICGQNNSAVSMGNFLSHVLSLLDICYIVQ